MKNYKGNLSGNAGVRMQAILSQLGHGGNFNNTDDWVNQN
jgi:hypothetical protein